MEEKLPIQEMILKHFNEPENQRLTLEIDSLRKQSEENEAYYQTTKKIWEAAAETKRLNGISLKKSVNDFRLRLNEGRTFAAPKKLFAWGRVAAAAVLVLATGFWIYNEKVTVDYVVKSTKGEIDSVLLGDGTKIILAANSTVRYPEQFSKSDRPVNLVKGQAFFLVSNDPSRPFEVAIGHSKVKVLGTSFNINYSDANIDLAVATGRVLFTPNEKSKPSILGAGEGINYRYLANTVSLEHNQNAASWFTKELRFVDMPLDEVCQQLSEYYGVRIVLHDKKLTIKKFNAKFKNISLEEALTALKETYPILVKKQGETIIIKSL